MANPSPLCTVQDGGGGAQATTNGVNVTAGNVITIALFSTAGVNSWSITIFGQDELVAPPSLSVNNTNKTATFTAPTAPWSLIFKSTVNGGVDINGVLQSSFSTTFKVCTLTAGGKRLAATNETSENDSTNGWTSIVNIAPRAGSSGITQLTSDVLAGPGSGSQAATVVQLTGSAGVVTVPNGTAIAMGTNPAAAGATIRIPKNTFITARNSIDTGNYNVAGTNGSDSCVFGDVLTNSSIYNTSSGGVHSFNAGGSTPVSIAGLNMQLFNNGTPAFGGGSGVLGISNASVVPTTNPSGGTVVYTQAGALKARGSSGTITTMATAEPHCPNCGADFMTEHESDKYGYLAVCLKCLADELGSRSWILRSKS